MADPALNIPRMSASEYMQFERHASDKHEFVDGIVYAMSGSTRQHNLIAGDVFGALLNRLQPPCIVYSSDVKVHVKQRDREGYYYPDTQVTCSDLDNDPLTTSMPLLVVEVPSDSTAGYDRNAKFESYRLLPSLQEYVILQQNEPKLELFRKRTEWKLEAFGPMDNVTFESVQLTFPVAQFYRRVVF